VRKNGEGILYRLQEHKHNPDKDYWTEAVVFTTSNNSFGPTEISCLENRFTNMAVAARRYQVKNGNEPTPGNITEEKESELEEFIDYAKIVMGTLGHKVFEPLTDSKQPKWQDRQRRRRGDKIYRLPRGRYSAGGRGGNGRGAPGHIIFADSHFSNKEQKFNVRLTLKDKGTMIKTL
jgi:hypothetical protein